MSTYSEPSYLTSFMFGGLGQLTDLLTLGHILNRVSTQQQTHPMRLSVTLQNMYKKGGIGEFYAGLRWNLVMACWKGAARWTLNNALFKFYGNRFTDSPYVPVLVGFTGAFIETTITCPLELMRTKEMTMSTQQRSQGIRGHVLALKQEGLLTFSRGWGRIFTRQVITWTSYLYFYDKYRQLVMSTSGKKKATGLEKAMVSIATGSTACLFSTPFDMLRTQIQQQTPLIKPTLSSAKIIFSQHGMYGFYASLPARMMRSSWYSFVTLFVMDYFNALPKRMKM